MRRLLRACICFGESAISLHQMLAVPFETLRIWAICRMLFPFLRNCRAFIFSTDFTIPVVNDYLVVYHRFRNKFNYPTHINILRCHKLQVMNLPLSYTGMSPRSILYQFFLMLYILR